MARRNFSTPRLSVLPLFLSILSIFATVVPAVTIFLAPSAQAAGIVAFSPQGEVAQVAQVRAVFSEPAVQFGDPRAPAPFDVACGVPGSGRWADAKNWIFDFNQAMPPGINCKFTLKSGFKFPSGATPTGKTVFTFNTGGPAVIRPMPSGGEIDEQQMFVLTLNGAATEASVRDHVYCEAEGIHERIPAQAVDPASRKQLLAAFAEDIDPARVVTLQCQQRLPNDAAVTLTWDKGIATPSGIATSRPQLFKYTVRAEFRADFSCQRENANAACSPILPLELIFSAPVPRKLAEGIVLDAGGNKVKPVIAASGEMVTNVSFKGPFPEKSDFTITLPSGFKDDSGRTLVNADMFPLKSRSADYPPLAKFAAAPFGVVELNADATLPLTVRRVEKALLMRQADGKVAPGTLANLKVDDDKGIIAWMNRLQRPEQWGSDDKKAIDTRSVSWLKQERGAKLVDLPQLPDAKADERPFEVIGIPFAAPGFYVLELASQKLGASLLARQGPMYVRTSALVTNLSVHVKLGRENGAVWVTTLDSAAPVPNADVRISDCRGAELWRGKTDASGVAAVPAALENPCDGMPYSAREGRIAGLFVSARKTDAKGRADLAFALTSWNDGIESWRFNLPTNTSHNASVSAHTILDRPLFRAGETVSMKHVIRLETAKGQGLALLPKERLPNRVRIVHQGSGQEFQMPLAWRDGKHGETVFTLPLQAKLGSYDIVLDQGTAKGGNEPVPMEDTYGDNVYSTGSFRVEEFRLPVLQGRITPPKAALIAPRQVPLDVQLNYLNGGGASGHPVQVSSLLRAKALNFDGYDGYTFQPPRQGDDGDGDSDDQKIVADKLPVTLDKNGAGHTEIKNLPPIQRPQELLTEMTYADPNGEIQTVSTVTPVWPSAVVVGIKGGDWVSVKKKIRLTVVALNTAGQVQAGVPITLRGVARRTDSHRKRMVGGFYTYENAKSSHDLGELCSGKSDGKGLLSCEVALNEPGNIDIVASGKDSDGHAASAATSLWVTRQGELWFDGGNQDRIDILPEKKSYQPGETARFQVRMPFRHATALVAVEREGVMETHVVQLDGDDPTVSLPVKAAYGPNVFVSVLAVRGRMREVPWYSFFKWGWKEPLNWWREFREYEAPSTLVDLSKPAWKYGIAEIAVGNGAHALKVAVSADKASYPIRGTAKVTVQVNLPDGKPAANAEIALAAVDEALLELAPNDSWNLLAAMLQRRSYGVETATAQMQVIGKRHYGRKAAPAGGGGGKAPTRELFDTLLLWKPVVALDANGRASIDVPLNDALTSFRIVAVAESGVDLFGTGALSVRSTQDVQIISGLPPLVREGDQFDAGITVRNTTTHDMRVAANARIAGQPALQQRMLAIPAGQAREAVWQVAAPQDVSQLTWEIGAQEQGGAGAAKDAIKITQRVVPAVPVTVQQATLFQLDKAASMPVMQPAGSLPGRGGLALGLQASLAGDNDGLRRYFLAYPFSCLEQQASRAIGLHDDAMWQRMSTVLPTYLDEDGLAYYFPPAGGVTRSGSDTLTAYLLAISNEAGLELPPQSRDKMLDGLSAFVEGKLTRNFWTPQKDLDVRKLAALEALSRYGRARPEMLGSIQVNPNLWPTSAVLDWIALLQRTAAMPNRDKRLEEADQILRARLNYQGTRLNFSTESSDNWWWLMAGADLNAIRLVLVELDNPAWRDDMPKILAAAIGRQARGHWDTTTANAWGTLALKRFARKFEGEKVAGVTRATLEQGGAPAVAMTQSFNWNSAGNSANAAGAANSVNAIGKLQLPWGSGPAGGTVKLAQDGKGKPWITLQSLAAVPLKTAFSSGYRIGKTVTAVEQKQSGVYTRGDVLRVDLEVDAMADMRWVAVTDPIPGGASMLGTGLGRDSAIATGSERANRATDYSGAMLAYEERSSEAYRAYYDFVPKGKWKMSYTVRLNNAGKFNLPQTRVEAMYAPEMFGESPNATITVLPEK
ncbi:MAG TPA: MG2 domain-containing protein [Herbaspirillum sp.]